MLQNFTFGSHGEPFRTNLNSDSTKLAGVDSSHCSNSCTKQSCRRLKSLQFYKKKKKKQHYNLC